MKKSEGEDMPKMQLNGVEMQPDQMGMLPRKYDVLTISPEKQLLHDYIIKVTGASVMQNSRASMLDQMIRLMQTQAEDGMPCVPREAVLDYLPDINKQTVMKYFAELKQEQQQREQQQMMNNEAMQQMQVLGQQLQEVGGVVGTLKQRADQEDEANKRDEMISQGYQQGMTEAQLLQTQTEKSGQLPPELLQEIAEMDDETLGMLLQKHPEIVDML